MEKDKVIGYILNESVTESKPDIVESNPNFIRFKAILQEGDAPNRNKRIYPTNVLRQALETDYVKERLETNAWYGECGHPISTDSNRQMNIDQTRISHIIKKVWMEDNLVMGIIETAATQTGRDMMNLIKYNKSKVAFSMRGWSPVSENKNGLTYVGGPLTILTYDWVIHPSHPKSYLKEIMSESTITELYDSANNFLNESASFIPINKEQFNTLQKESKNFYKMTKMFNFSENAEISINENNSLLFVKENNETYAVNMEDFCKNKIGDFIKAL